MPVCRGQAAGQRLAWPWCRGPTVPVLCDHKGKQHVLAAEQGLQPLEPRRTPVPPQQQPVPLPCAGIAHKMPLPCKLSACSLRALTSSLALCSGVPSPESKGCTCLGTGRLPGCIKSQFICIKFHLIYLPKSRQVIL